MVKKRISLICIKLKDDTDIMYNIFENIYKNRGIIFNIISLNSPEDLVKIVVDKSVEVYDKQNNIDQN